MRIRQVKPSFFKDPTMAGLSPAVRLFYIGLWLLADDAGWFRWDAAEVGNELYGYEPRARRERNVMAYLDVLLAEGRVVRHECGHMSIPTFPDHQRLSGLTKQVRTEWREHETRCLPQTPADARDSPQMPGSGSGNGTVEERGTVGNGKVRESAREADLKEGETQREYARRMGLPPPMSIIEGRG
jgi:hypothetical protein